MIKRIKIFINPIIALIFLCSIISSANVIEYTKCNDDCVVNAGDCVRLDDINKNYLPSGENYNEEIMLLNGKYAVMTDRSERPKTKINYNETPEPSPSFYMDIPPQFSWKDYGGDWTTPAKDQGNCGSCWAFSALSAMESAINIASGYPDTDLDLSEQYILSCLPYGGSCNGGWTDDAFEAIINTGPIGNYINGVPIESCMPYTQTDYFPCDDKCDDWDFVELSENGVLWELESWGANHNLENDDPSDRDIVKGYIMDFGPMSTSMYATSGFSNYFNTHHDPNDWYWEEDYSYTNHAVLLLGWKDDSSVTNGGYWILKNSWGTGFGYEGYFNVAYGGLKIAEIVRWCFTPEWPQPSDDDDDNDGPGPIWPPMHVFADFSYGPDYPKLGTTIEFDDTSQGNVVLREWDLNDDGVIDSNARNPNHVYYEEGVYNVTLIVWSSAGLNSTMTRLVEVKEIWPPFAVASPWYYGGDNFEITFEGRHSYDVDGDIISYHWDFDDGTTSDDSYVTHIFGQGNRIYNVALTVTDNEGAQSTVYCDIRIDLTIPPETLIHVFGCEDLDQWFKTNIRINLIAEDWSGIDDTYYMINDGEYQTYMDPFIISEEGQYTIRFYSVDIYGNQENVKSQTIKIDKTPPTLDIEIIGSKENDWYTTPIEVILNGGDQLSGLDKIIYKIDQGSWETYTSPLTFTDGEYRLWAYSVDKAGNNYGSDDPIVIKVDAGAPVSHYFFNGDGSNNIFYKTVNIALSATDHGSGIENIYYSVDGSGFEIYSSPFDIDEIGDHSISVYAVDNIGNREETQSIVITVSDINFNMELAKPTNGLYIMGNRIFNIGNTIILGGIDIEVDISAFTSVPPDIQYVEFFIDGVSKMTDSSAPYGWTLNEQMFGTHEIKVTAHSGEGPSITKTIDAMIFIFF